MKVMTILGTRPEIIRLSRIIPKLDSYCEHLVVHTGQNYECSLNRIFFTELGLRSPDYMLECKSETLMSQIGRILTECERVLLKEKPDRLLILGDTNSALAAVTAKRMNIPVFHLEAGNRCYDDRVPEEVNRRVVDHCSDVLMPYTERSRANLIREGIDSWRIYVIGNPIGEVLNHYEEEIEKSRVLKKQGIEPGQYLLVTLHRAENVDNWERLDRFVEALHLLQAVHRLPVIVSLHPRTRSQLQKLGRTMDGKMVRAIEPLGFFDFVKLEKHALCILSDSGTVQEECCILNIPNVTLRDVTERPETLEAGASLLSGCEPGSITRAVDIVLGMSRNWTPPKEYKDNQVSSTVTKILLGTG